MRIAHFCDSHPGRTDGVSVAVGLTVALLRAAGHEVDHYHPGPLLGPAAPGRLRSVAVPFRLIRVALPGQAPPRGRRFDLVHVHTTGPVGTAGLRLAAAQRVPAIVTWHTDLLAYAEYFAEIPVGAALCAATLRLGWTPREYLELTNLCGRRRSRLLALGPGLFAGVGLVIAPSAKTAAGLAEIPGCPPVRVIATPLVQDREGAGTVGDGAVGDGAVGDGTVGDGTVGDGRDRARLRARLGLAPRAPVVLSVGRVTPEKNPALLLAAFARLRARRPDAALVVLGARQGRRRLLRRVRALGLDPAVRLLAPVPRAEVDGYYRMADVLAFASTTDTQGLVLAEAEAAGLAVVVADPGLDGRPGTDARRLTCTPEPGALAAALGRVLDDAGLRERVVRDGLRAVAAYPPRRYLELLLAAYDQALGRTRR